MDIDGVPFRTIWLADDTVSVGIIDQRTLPLAFTTRAYRSIDVKSVEADKRKDLMRVVQPAGSLGGEA